MNCFAAFEVGKHRLLCHRPPGHDGKHAAVLYGTVTVHWFADDVRPPLQVVPS